ncbi:MAG: serine/threonine-protein kinase [Pseudomonadota bacterium]
MTLQSDIEQHLPESSGAVGDELPPGTVLCNGQYVIEEFLNSGGFGVTYLARDSLDRKVVIKECFPNAMCCRSGQTVRLRSQSFESDFTRVVDLFQKEARALARLQHPSIVGVHGIFEANNTAYMALDFVAGMDLFDLMEKHPEYLTPALIKSILTSLLKALVYVHENGILHRDISPDNILLDANGAPVLIDFGASRQGTNRSRILTRVHTVKDGYSPQEFYFEGSLQSHASDLYALAATIVHLITGTIPPSSSARLAAVSEQKTDPYVPLADRYPAYSADFCAALDRCMSVFAKDRLPSAKEWLFAIKGEAQIGLPDIVPPKIDINIDRKIAELVAQCNAQLAKDVERKRDVPAEPSRAPAIEADRRKKEQEYWAILNEDPAAIAKEAARERRKGERRGEEARENSKVFEERVARVTSRPAPPVERVPDGPEFSLLSLLRWQDKEDTKTDTDGQ